MKIVADTNIIFSTISNSIIAVICVTKLTLGTTKKEEQLQISYTQVLPKLKFINEEIIPVETWIA